MSPRFAGFNLFRRALHISLWISLLALLPTLVAAAPRSPNREGLLAIRLDGPEALPRAAAAGLTLYDMFSTPDGELLLAGYPVSDAAQPSDLGLESQLLLSDATAADIYMAYAPPDRPAPDWRANGEILLSWPGQALLATDAVRAEALVEAGAEIVRVTLDPKPWPTPAAPLALAAVTSGPVTPDPAVRAMIDQVSAATVAQYTNELTGEAPTTVNGASFTITSRHSYGATIDEATQWAGERLAARGMAVDYHTWSGASYPNVIGQITGVTSPDVIYIIGGHLDDMPSSGLAPGADDNASGSVATLIAADILSQYQWNCTLRFAFWTGEEQGLLGSAAYASRAKGRGENIAGYLNMDMIAYNSGAPNDIDLYAKSAVPGSVVMRDLFADVVTAYGLNLVPTRYLDASLGDRSDNKSFWNQGYPSILAIEDYSDFNPRYHASSDRLMYLDLAYYTEFIKASLATFVHLNGCLAAPSTPTPTATATPSATATATVSSTPTVTSTGTATPTATSTATSTATASNTPTVTATGTATSTATNTATPTATATTPPVATERLYISSSDNGTVGGVSFSDEDVLVQDRTTGAWQLYFDGSDVGVSGDVDAFDRLADGSLLLSMEANATITGLGTVDGADLVRFVPTSIGATTAGAFEWYFDGSDVGLTTSGEKLDLVSELADGRLLLSTNGQVGVPGLIGNDEDLLLFTPTSLGANTSGTWTLYFDGSDVGLTANPAEDVDATWADPSGALYLSTTGNFSVPGLSGDGSDVFVCNPISLGDATACAFTPYWDGSANGFSGRLTDAVEVER
jgi:hypothetical protein